MFISFLNHPSYKLIDSIKNCPLTHLKFLYIELQEQYNIFKTSISQLTSKITELEGELDEHKLVLGTLSETPKDRTCFRMVGSTLIKQTVKDVVPALNTNSDKLVFAIDTLQKQLRNTQEELNKWRIKYQVQIVSAN